VPPTSSGTTPKHGRNPGDRAQRAVGERRAPGSTTKAPPAKQQTQKGGGCGAPVTHVGTIARHGRAARRVRMGMERGKSGPRRRAAAASLTATRCSPPRRCGREAARRAGGNDTGQAGDTEASCSGSGRRVAEGTNCKGTRWGRGAGPPRRPSRAGGAHRPGSGARHQGVEGGRNCRRPF
jgi:hypothetical protein